MIKEVSIYLWIGVSLYKIFYTYAWYIQKKIFKKVPSLA